MVVRTISELEALEKEHELLKARNCELYDGILLMLEAMEYDGSRWVGKMYDAKIHLENLVTRKTMPEAVKRAHEQLAARMAMGDFDQHSKKPASKGFKRTNFWTVDPAHFVDSEDCQGNIERYWRQFATSQDQHVVMGRGVTKEQAEQDCFRLMEEFDELHVDLSGEEARALHRIVRGMHDGHCAKCGTLADAASFVRHVPPRHECPKCGFLVLDSEAKDALAEFHPHLQKSVELFEQWRDNRKKENSEEVRAAVWDPNGPQTPPPEVMDPPSRRSPGPVAKGMSQADLFVALSVVMEVEELERYHTEAEGYSNTAVIVKTKEQGLRLVTHLRPFNWYGSAATYKP